MVMRKLIVFNMITLDGFFEGPNHEIDWHKLDPVFQDFSSDQLSSMSTIIFGRKTYELMASYWPTTQAIANDSIIAEKMNSKPKIVFSKSLQKAEWHNTRLIKGNLSEEIIKLKEEPGNDMIIFGSSKLSASLLDLELIDEIRVIINPVILGQGHALFANVHKKINLELLASKIFESGNILLCYQPVKN